MATQGRVGRIPKSSLAWLAVGWLLAGIGLAQESDPPEKLHDLVRESTAKPVAFDPARSDASINDVCFVDAQHGWAVGDRGAIWHTDDGGKQWVAQESGVACRLESVSFISPQVGWSAGWIAHPYLRTGAGVLLWTQDCGQTWKHDPKLILPALKRIRFFGPRHGLAVGCPSMLYPSGVLVTDSAGQGWNPVVADKTSGWVAADFLGPQAAAMVDRMGIAAVLRRSGLARADLPEIGLRAATRLKLTAPNGGWLVGQGGLILRTADTGASWHSPPGEMPGLAPWQFDFSALEVRGPKCWVAGSPGTRIFHTADAGQTWTATPTGQNVPLRAICFVDDQNGWAVGQLGTILATSDGGQTWRRQRAGGARATLLGLFGEPSDVPLELFAHLAGSEGYLSVVELLGRRDRESRPRDEVALADRAHDALVRVGAAGVGTAWQFPLRPRGIQVDASQVTRIWDQLHDGRGMDAMEEYLVRKIRMWRPDVIVTQEASADNDPLGGVLNQAVLRAVSLAADPAAYPHQTTQAGLEPWKAQRVYSSLPPGLQGEANVSSGQLADRQGRTVGDLAGQARSLVEERPRLAVDSLGFQVMFDQMPQQEGRRDFFAGIPITAASDARRTLSDSGSGTLEMVHRTAQKRRTLQAMIQRSGRDARSAAALMGQTQELLRGLDPDSATQLLLQLAQTYFAMGQWRMSADVYELVLELYPDHPVSRAALVWLAQFYASSEAAYRVEGGVSTPVRQVSTAPGPSVEMDRLARAAQIGQLMQQLQPDLTHQPAVSFPLASGDRQRGTARDAERAFAASSRGLMRDAWSGCARGEQWLAERRGVPPKPVLRCPLVQGKPKLDGRLDDEIWKDVSPAVMHSLRRDEGTSPAEVLLCRDGQFLYLGIRARQAAGVRYDPTPGSRPRDANLTTHDRVEIFLDLDRDYATYYRLAVDHRGWTAEDCWGDPNWNPTWFVSALTIGDEWTVEAAIPLNQLTKSQPGAATAWAIGLQRTIPGVGFQSWSQPAAPEVVPEGFGYLVFD